MGQFWNILITSGGVSGFMFFNSSSACFNISSCASRCSFCLPMYLKIKKKQKENIRRATACTTCTTCSKHTWALFKNVHLQNIFSLHFFDHALQFHVADDSWTLTTTPQRAWRSKKHRTVWVGIPTVNARPTHSNSTTQKQRLALERRSIQVWSIQVWSIQVNAVAQPNTRHNISTVPSSANGP